MEEKNEELDSMKRAFTLLLNEEEDKAAELMMGFTDGQLVKFQRAAEKTMENILVVRTARNLMEFREKQ